MLIKFSVKNFKTFRERAELSMVASNYDKTMEEENIVYIPEFDLRILKSAVVYGANASGKSKLMEAFSAMRRLILTSSKETQKGDVLRVEPFKLNTSSEHQPTEFEIVFLYHGKLFRYGFEADKTHIISEWLYHKPNTKEIELFHREGQEFNIHARSFPKGKTLVKEKLVRENTLMLSAAAQWNDEKAGEVLDWVRSFNVISGLEEDAYATFTLSELNDPIKKNKQLAFLQKADLDIQDLTLEKMELSKIPTNIHPEFRAIPERKLKDGKEMIADVLTAHKKYDEHNRFIENINFSLQNDESSGTLKFFLLSGPILYAINNGCLLVIDELDSSLHPNLVTKIVELFNSKVRNPNNAQLIFNTHNTNLLSVDLFRRDQVWFTEKNRYGEAALYSLADFKTSEVRKEDNFEKNYIRGKYGAVPYLGDFELV